MLGAILAGCYGLTHDQLTYTLSPEYYTRLKIVQFSYADLGLGDRIWAGTIGFVAAAWPGLVAGWLLARRNRPDLPALDGERNALRGMLTVLLCAAAFGSFAAAYGCLIDQDALQSRWSTTLNY